MDSDGGGPLAVVEAKANIDDIETALTDAEGYGDALIASGSSR